MEEIQSLVDISHIVPPMKMGKAAVCGYRRYPMVQLHVPLLHLSPVGSDQYSRIWHERDQYSRIWHERYGGDAFVLMPIVGMLGIDKGDGKLFGR